MSSTKVSAARTKAKSKKPASRKAARPTVRHLPRIQASEASQESRRKRHDNIDYRSAQFHVWSNVMDIHSKLRQEKTHALMSHNDLHSLVLASADVLRVLIGQLASELPQDDTDRLIDTLFILERQHKRMRG